MSSFQSTNSSFYPVCIQCSRPQNPEYMNQKNTCFDCMSKHHIQDKEPEFTKHHNPPQCSVDDYQASLRSMVDARVMSGNSQTHREVILYQDQPSSHYEYSTTKQNQASSDAFLNLYNTQQKSERECHSRFHYLEFAVNNGENKIQKLEREAVYFKQEFDSLNQEVVSLKQQLGNSESMRRNDSIELSAIKKCFETLNATVIRHKYGIDRVYDYVRKNLPESTSQTQDLPQNAI